MKSILIIQFILFLVLATVPGQEVNTPLATSFQIRNENGELSQTSLVEVFENNKRKIIEVIDSSQINEYGDSIKIIKTFNFKKTTFSPPVTSNNKYYISTSVGRVICLDTQGEIIWEYNTDGLIYSSLLIDKDLIITMTSEGDLFTINANNGDVVQVIGIGEAITSDIRLIDLEFNRMNTKGIIFGTTYGNIYCYELYSLEMVWENYITDSTIISKPLVVNNKIIFETMENYYCVNAKNGTLIWKWKKAHDSETTSFQCDLISNGKSVFYIDEKGKLFSIDLLLGTAQWKKGKKLKASGKLFMTVNTNEMIVHSRKNQFLVVKQSNGKVKKKIDLPDELKNSLPVCLLEIGPEKLLGFDNGLICKLDMDNKIEIILSTGNAPVISIISLGGDEYLTNNLDSKIVRFFLQ